MRLRVANCEPSSFPPHGLHVGSGVHARIRRGRIRARRPLTQEPGIGHFSRILRPRNDARDPEVVPETMDADHATAAMNVGDGVTATVDLANRHSEAGRYAQSLAAIDSAAADVAHHPRLRMARAETLMRWGRHREALAELCAIEASGHQRCRHLSKPCVREMRPLGRIVRCCELAGEGLVARSGFVPGAFRALDRVAIAGADRRGHRPLVRSLELRPRASEGMFHLGALRCNGTSIAEAEAIFRRLVERNPMNADAWKNLGVCLYRQDRAEEALAAGTRADAIASERRTKARDVRRARHLSARLRESASRRVDMLERDLARFPIRRRTICTGNYC